MKKVLYFTLFLFLGFISFSLLNTSYSSAKEVSGNVYIYNKAVFNKDEADSYDMNWLQKESENSSSNISYKENGNKIDFFEKLDSNGAEVSTTVDSTQTKDNHYNINVDEKNPIIYIKSKMGEVMGRINLSKEEIDSGKVKDKNIYLDLASKLDAMETSDNSYVNTFNYYPYQHNGKKYKAGVHVVCNDFNGPINKGHIYYSRKVHPIKAAENFVGSDCDFNSNAYRCIMNGNKKCHGLNKKPGNCSRFSGGDKHTNFKSVKLWWRS